MTFLNAETKRRRDAEKTENSLTEQIIDAAIEVHRVLGGPGLLESLYENALFHELRLRNIPVQSQVCVPVIYKNLALKEPMRFDLLVCGKIIVEVKAIENEHNVYRAQALTYLRLTGLKLGLVINFGHGRLVDGITRVVNDL